MKILFPFLLIALCTATHSRSDESYQRHTKPLTPELIQKIEGTWKGKWDAMWPLEVTFKHLEGNEFHCVRKHLENFSDEEFTVQEHPATYDPKNGHLHQLDAEFFWHDDGKRLVAKFSNPKTTRHAIMKKVEPEQEQDQPPAP